MSISRQEMIYGTLGPVFHACLRQVCDSEQAGKAWSAIDQMDEEWGDVCDFVAQIIDQEWNQAYAQDQLFEMIKNNIGAGIHTCPRKFCSSEAADQAWDAIKAMPDHEWSEVIDWTAKRVYEEQIEYQAARERSKAVHIYGEDR